MDGRLFELNGREEDVERDVNKAISSNQESSSGEISSSEPRGRRDSPSGPLKFVAGT